jgi:hypothetical protein
VSRDPVIAASVPFTELSLILLLLTTGAAAIACVYAPLRVLAAEVRPGASPRRLFGGRVSATWPSRSRWSRSSAWSWATRTSRSPWSSPGCSSGPASVRWPRRGS